MNYSKVAVLVIAAIGAGVSQGAVQQPPDPVPASVPAVAAVPTDSAREAAEAAALIAKAKTVATANANAREASVTPSRTDKVEASPEARKKASEFGFHAEIYKGTTVFCRRDAALGSRIPLVRCMSEFEYDDYAVQLKIARDMLQSKTPCNAGKVIGNPCGGLQ